MREITMREQEPHTHVSRWLAATLRRAKGRSRSRRRPRLTWEGPANAESVSGPVAVAGDCIHAKALARVTSVELYAAVGSLRCPCWEPDPR
jgi:hypothetical protein